MSTFQELALTSNVKTRLKELKFNELFPIQEEAISPLLKGQDVIGQAKTGTGKTAAYAIPIIEKLRKQNEVQALIIVPTRELAQQVENQFKDLARYTSYHFTAIFGGEPIGRQIAKIPRTHVIIGTPGRLIDHLSRGTLHLDKIRTLVIDEADRMLDMGFIDDLRFIINHLPKNRQTCMFSATMPQDAIRLAKTSMNNPVKILVDKDEISVEEIEQQYCLVERKYKLPTLIELIRQFRWRKILIFAATRWRTEWLVDKLNRVIVTQALHGGLSQPKRDAVLQLFRNATRNIIVATDLASRGIDIADIECIINYDMPQDPLTYFHRIGRTGRAGEHGIAVSIVSYEDGPILASIKSLTKIQLKELTRQHLSNRSVSWTQKPTDQNQLVESIF
jgi:ATP-dependent RNA helicase DeaD